MFNNGYITLPVETFCFIIPCIIRNTYNITIRNYMNYVKVERFGEC
jgi:hypothetical protein